MVDKIIRYENLDKELIENGILSGSLPIVNQSKRTHYSEYFTAKTEEAVKQIYFKDFVLFYKELL